MNIYNKLNYDLQNLILNSIFTQQKINKKICIEELNIYISFYKNKIFGLYNSKINGITLNKKKKFIYNNFIL